MLASGWSSLRWINRRSNYGVFRIGSSMSLLNSASVLRTRKWSRNQGGDGSCHSAVHARNRPPSNRGESRWRGRCVSVMLHHLSIHSQGKVSGMHCSQRNWHQPSSTSKFTRKVSLLNLLLNIRISCGKYSLRNSQTHTNYSV